jgi:hypothetical protein
VQVNILPEYPVTTGQREVVVGYGIGPTAYDSTNKDALLFPNGIYVDAVNGAMTVSGTYFVRAFPSVTGTTRASWKFVWYTASSGAEVSNAVDLSAEKVQFDFLGGAF